jgi:hypothetical protein
MKRSLSDSERVLGRTNALRAYPEYRAFFLALLSSRPGLLPSLPLPTPDPLRSPSFPLRVPLPLHLPLSPASYRSPAPRRRERESKRASCPGPCCFACDVLSVINCPSPFTQVTSLPPSLPPLPLPPSVPLPPRTSHPGTRTFYRGRQEAGYWERHRTAGSESARRRDAAPSTSDPSPLPGPGQPGPGPGPA